MPTYSYRCTECDHAFDIRQSFSDEALTACPECGGRLRKNFGSVGVVFKGSGFYRTDSRDSGSSSSVPSGASSSDPAGSGSKDSAPKSSSSKESSSSAATASSAPASSSTSSDAAAS
ncbi:FmdB family transcriptional regulator [Sediminivirga luteola]|nr:FmdB family transcriptional regulator [Sediminivirga luteola]